MERTHRYRLKLYITGGTETARQALYVLRELSARLKDKLEAEVIDILMHPELMLDPGLGLTPVFVREDPTPATSCRDVTTDADRVIRDLRLDR